MEAIGRLQRRIGELEQRRSTPIAVISMACRFPGGADTPEAFWRLLDEGRDAITEVPAYRWNIDRVYDADPDKPGATYSRVGGFIGEVDRFDPLFFGMSPREALSVDPRERVLLETSWEALERAGITMRDLAGSKTGVFMGMVTLPEYQLGALADRERIDAYSLLGTCHSSMAGRLSYLLGIRGPNFPVDTACSSSLLALHLAAQSLRAGECDAALVGGVNLLLAPEGYVYFSRLQALSKTGRCRAFSADADGYVRGEGCGVLVLKRLSDAQKNGDQVLAVLRGSAVNQDGRSNGFTAPNGLAQQELLRQATEDAALDPADVDVIECHGTGTPLGDPIEVESLAAVYGRRPADRPLLLTAVKTNIGHAEAAAGIAGVIKGILALQHERIPRSLHFDGRPNPNVPWSDLRVKVVDEAVDWPRAATPRRIGVSSFGFSGTNVHVILEEAPATSGAQSAERAVSLPQVPLVVSGDTEAALRANAKRLAEHLELPDAPPLADVAYTLARYRSPFRERIVFPAVDVAAARSSLRAVAAGEVPSGAVRATARRTRAVFVFPGQGSQYPGMCRGLLSDATFASALSDCDRVLRPHTGFSVVDILRGNDDEQREAFAKSAVVQPVLFAVAWALSRLWKHYGVEPSAVVGHSQGEVAAAVVCGALSLEEGARVVSLRSRLTEELVGDGAMASIGLPVAQVEALLKEREGLSIAVVNTADSAVVAGARSAVDALVSELTASNVFCRKIAVDYAAHSSQVDPILSKIRAGLSDISPRVGATAFFSTVVGRALTGQELGADYWAENLRNPVRLDLALEALGARQDTLFLEISAHPLLAAPLSLAGYDAVVGSLHRDMDATVAIRMAAAELHSHGLRVDWDVAFAGTGARRTALPTYAFQRQRYWLEPSRASVAARHDGDGAPRGEPCTWPLAGRCEALPGGGLLHWVQAGPGPQPELADHLVYGRIVLPGVFHASLLLSIAASHWPGEWIELRDLELLEAVVFDDRDGCVPMRVHLVPDGEDGGFRATIDAWHDGRWTVHATARVAAVAPRASLPAAPAFTEGRRAISLDAFFDATERHRVGGGRKWWRWMRTIEEERRLRRCKIEADGPTAADSPLSTVFLDTGIALAVAVNELPADGVPHLPFAIERLTWTGTALRAGSTATLRPLERTGGSSTCELVYMDEAGTPVVHVEGLILKRAPAARFVGGRRGGGLYTVTEVELSPLASSANDSLVVSPAIAQLEANGAEEKDLIVRWPEGDATQEGIRGSASAAIEWLQRWLSLDRRAARHVVWATGPVAGSPANAAIWGVGRTALLEHPDRRLVLLEIDGAPTDEELRAIVARLPHGEPQLTFRAGRFHALRLREVEPPGEASPAPELDPNGTVLVTGGTRGLGGRFARHLIERHGVKHVLLLSRSGPRAEGASELVAEITSAGAAVRVRACDVSDRAALAAAIDEIPPQHPLVAVVHAAGILDDAPLTEQTAEHLEAVFRAKVDGAWHLHALTADKGLARFILFSSVAGVVGHPAQANYAAANAALDALATLRRREGLAATSLAWGPWNEIGIVARLDKALQDRLWRMGWAALDVARGLELFDEALERPEPALTAMNVDVAALEQNARGDRVVPSTLRELVRTRVRRAPGGERAKVASPSTLATRLANVPEIEREQVVMDLVRAEVAAVVGFASAGEIDADRAFSELGLDSLMAVSLRRRLGLWVDAPLPITLAFEYPTVRAIARRLLQGVPAPVPLAVAPRDARGEGAIAVVSLACRFPGGVASPEEFWRLLVEGRDAVGEVPAYRWPVARVFDADPEKPGATYSRVGGFLGEVDGFDASFFGISQREALTIDPRERILLETAWEAFERAGYTMARLAGSSTGVFVGLVSLPEYQLEALRHRDKIDAYTLLGTGHCAMAGRLSYWLGLQGPNFPIDTACSSSLVALHLACQSLRAGECNLALAGGVNLLLAPEGYIYFSRSQALSPTGRCRAFSADADGFVRAEGAGVVLLKRLEDAERDGDRILAIVRGTGVNQDGRSNGFTAPNGLAQRQLLHQTLRVAGVDPATVDAIECHGTGTRLGDPIEVQAIAGVYGEGRPKDRPIVLTSVKTNIGHAEAAAGVAGVIKAILSLQHERIPRSLHFASPNPNVAWEDLPVRVASEAMAFPTSPRPRRMAVSSFGFSGTNAHVILEEAPARKESAVSERRVELSAFPLMVSGHTEEALRGNAERLQHALGGSENGLLDTSHSLLTTRTLHRERVVVTVADVASARAALGQVARGELPNGGVRASGRRSRGVFVYPSQGSEHAGMCRSLMVEAAFAEALAECDEALRPHVGYSVKELLRASDAAQSEALSRVEVIQPLLFAVGVALTRVWESYGVRPAAVMGHGQGEVVAAVVSGALSLEDGARVVSVRSRLVKELKGEGASVKLAVKEEEKLLARMREELEGISPRESKTPFYSTVRGKRLTGSELDAGYWAENLRQPVRLDRALSALGQPDTTLLVEVSAHPMLAGSLALSGYEAVTGTLHRESDAATAMRSSAAAVQAHGLEVDWEAAYAGTGARRVLLPTYAFQRQRYWLERSSSDSGDPTELGLERGGHPFLATKSELPDGGFLFTGLLDPARHGWLSEHRVFDVEIVPGAALVELLLHAAMHVGLDGVGEVVLEAPLALEPKQTRRLRLSVGAEDAHGQRGFTLSSSGADGGWIHHASGLLGTGGAANTDPEPVDWPPPNAAPHTLAGVYDELAAAGISYGASYRGLQRAWRAGHVHFIESELPPPAARESERFGIHPALLDSVLQVLVIGGRSGNGIELPFEWRGVRLLASGATAVRARVVRSANGVRVDVFDAAGAPVLVIAGLRGRAASAKQIERALRVPSGAARRALPLVLSADTPAALRDDAARLAAWLEGNEASLIDMAYTAATARPAFRHRAAIVVSGDENRKVAETLDLLGRGERPAAVVRQPEGYVAGKLAVLFTGQGSQRVGMARGLYEADGSFRAHLDAVVAALDAHLDRPLGSVLFAAAGTEDAERVHDTRYTQPALFAIEVALFERLRSLGMKADLLLGHSIGELVAAHVAGLLSLEDAARLVAARGRAMQRCRQHGAMASIRARADEVRAALTDGVCIAAVNAPDHTVVSGDAVEVDAVARWFESRSHKVTRLKVSHAFHSAHMEDACAELEEVAASCTFHSLKIPLVSNVTGALATFEELATPRYWSRQMREPVQFLAGVRALAEAGATAFVECGPDGVLCAAAAQCLPDDAVAMFMSVLRKDEEDERAFARALAGIHAAGHAIDWEALFAGSGARRVPLPSVDPLYRVAWVDVELGESERSSSEIAVVGGDGRLAAALGCTWHASVASLTADPPPRAVVVDATAPSAEPSPDATVTALAGVLVTVQQWSAAAELSSAELVVVTSGAVDARDGGGANPLGAAIWGLVRGARAEDPTRRVRLFDLPSPAVDGRVVRRALAEPQEQELALRGAVARAPRLDVVAASDAPADARPPFDPNGTVLVTGGSGDLGALVARHLVTRHGARHLVLAGRRGAEAGGARELERELRALGAETVSLERCDVTDRTSVEAVVAAIPADRPLTAIVHAAGVVEDATIASVTPEQLARVVRPKIDGAVHLAEAARAAPLAAFVLFSSASGVFGNAGQASYGAANAFLDAFADRLRARGCPATSFAWGPWEQRGRGMTSHLGEAHLARFRRQGLVPLTSERGLAFFDRALAAPLGSCVALSLDLAALASSDVPALLRDRVPLAAGRGARSTTRAGASDPRSSMGEAEALKKHLRSIRPRERQKALLELVRTEIRAVLQANDAVNVPADKALKELDLDSLASIELRNRLAARTNVRLSATAVFDYPTPRALATHLELAMGVTDGVAAATPAIDDASFRAALADIPIAALKEAGLFDRLLALLPPRSLEPRPRTPKGAAPTSSIDAEVVREIADADLLRLAFEVTGGSK